MIRASPNKGSTRWEWKDNTRERSARLGIARLRSACTMLENKAARYSAGACICRKAGRRTVSVVRKRHSARSRFQNEVATQPEHDRSGTRVGLTESHSSGGCWLRGYHGVSRGTGSSSTPLCRWYFLNDGSVEQTTTNRSSTLPGARRSSDALRLWETAADVRAGRGGPSKELEEDSLAARHKGMAGIAIRGLTSTAVSWLRPWSTTAQGSLVADRMARVRKGTDQVLPLRSASHLHTATISTAREVSLEDRARLPATEGGTGIGSLRRAKLDRLAPPHDAGYVGSRISNSGSASQ